MSKSQDTRTPERGREQAGNRYSSSLRGENRKFDWGAVESLAIHRAIVAVAAVDDAILFARTSDGGAGLIRVISGGDGDSQYCKTAEDAQDTLTSISEAAEGFQQP